MFNVKFGFTTKRYNSTAQMSAFTQKFQANVALKEKCDLVNPVFIINVTKAAAWSAGSPNLAEINYCRCIEFMRYYFITQIVYVTNDIAEIYCSCDVLATFLDQIKECEFFIKYTSDTSKANGSIDDGRLVAEMPVPMNTTILFEKTEPAPDPPRKAAAEDALPFTDDSSKWTIAMTVTALKDAAGITVTYMMTIDTFSTLVYNIANYLGGQAVTNFDTFCSALYDLFGANGNLADYVHDIRLLPIDYTKYKATEEGITIGYVTYSGKQTTVGGKTITMNACKGKPYITPPLWKYRVENGVSIRTDTLGICPHDHSVGHDNWPYFLRSSKYIQMSIRHPGGTTPITNDQLCNLKVDMRVMPMIYIDMMNGDYIVELWLKDTDDLLGSCSGNVSMNIGKLLSGGGMGDIAGEITSGVMNLAGKVFDITKGQTTTEFTTSTTYSNNKNLFVSDDGDVIDKSKTFKTKDTQGTTTSRESLGNFGNYFGGSHQVSTGQGAASNNGFLNLAMAFMDHTDGSASTGNTFQIIASAMYPGVLAQAYVDNSGAAARYNAYDTYASYNGYPCSKVIQIKKIKLGSYIQCSGANIAMSPVPGSGLGHCMLPEEVSRINELLNSGFFYEDYNTKKDDVAQKASL